MAKTFVLQKLTHKWKKKRNERGHALNKEHLRGFPVVLQMNVPTSKPVRLITNHLLWWFFVVNVLCIC